MTVFFQCQPLALIWDASTPGQCIPPGNLKFAAFFNSSMAPRQDVEPAPANTPLPQASARSRTYYLLYCLFRYLRVFR